MFENYQDVEWAISSQDPLKWIRFTDYRNHTFIVEGSRVGIINQNYYRNGE
jgi:hypothetical protein